MQVPDTSKNHFTKTLMKWHYAHNTRSMPWKEEKDPYKIWLSEIILQQTRTLQGLPYYLKFIGSYPTVKHLAATDDETAFRLWQGLGYYNRCKNMLATARYIARELNGVFPTAYEDILNLKGIGLYTAAAIASFAYGAPYAVVDGNVIRVLARYFGVETPFDTTTGKKGFQDLAGQLLDKTDSAGYNQAIMDFGATVCTPSKPLCSDCMLRPGCFAYNSGLVNDLPVKSKKLKIKNRYFNYIIFRSGDALLISKRDGKDIWQNLHEPFLVETEEPVGVDVLLKNELLNPMNLPVQQLLYEGVEKQKLTHQLIETRFYSFEVENKDDYPFLPGKWVPVKDLKNMAFPKSIVSFLEKKLYF